MKSNREKFLALVSEIDTKTEEQAGWRVANRAWLHVSQDIAFDILERIDELGWSQKTLAEKMGVSPQYINKLVKGSENLTLETLVKLQNILDIPLLACYFKEKQAITQNNTYAFGEETVDYSASPKQD